MLFEKGQDGQDKQNECGPFVSLRPKQLTASQHNT
jgi:hypothetical protein